jgi:hypothetical protein
LIFFQVAQSNTAKCPSTAELGHTTSHVHQPPHPPLHDIYRVSSSTSADIPQSLTSAVVVQPSSVIVIIAVSHTFSTVAVGEYQGCHSSQSSHLGHCGQVGQVGQVGH